MKNIISLFFSIFLLNLSSSAQCINGSLLSVKTNKIGACNYVIFTFKGNKVPVFNIQSVSPPFKESPSDLPLTVNGCKFKSISFEGGTYCNVSMLGIRPLTVIKDIKRREQFEGRYEYIMGLRCKRETPVQYSYKVGKTIKYVLRYRI